VPRAKLSWRKPTCLVIVKSLITYCHSINKILIKRKHRHPNVPFFPIEWYQVKVRWISTDVSLSHCQWSPELRVLVFFESRFWRTGKGKELLIKCTESEWGKVS
jgi:hypothetical protein